MPDYDFKKIPVLDDIIEFEKNDPAEQTAIDALAPDEVDSNFDLFTDDSTEDETANLIDTAGAEISIFNEEVINDYVATVDDKQITAPVSDELAFAQEPVVDPKSLDSTPLESALIDYQTDEGIDNDNQAELTANQHPASLENIVNDVVKQLLPDLEQQLRFLVQQALEDKLPENIITQLTDKSEH